MSKPSNCPSILQRVTIEIEQGRLWKAKEILLGRISSHKYEPDIYFFYAELLLKMQDDLEAGKYFFLSGKSESRHQPIVDLYLHRYHKTHKNDFYSSFPKRARLHKLSQYPSGVADELKKRGFNENILEQNKNKNSSTLSEKIPLFLILSFLFLLLISFLVGAYYGLLKIVHFITK